MTSTSYVSTDKLESITCDFYVYIYDGTKTRDETIDELKRRLGDRFSSTAVFLLPFEPIAGSPTVVNWLQSTLALPNRDPSGTDIKGLFQNRAYQRYFDPEALVIQQSLGQPFSFSVEGLNDFYFAGLNHAGNFYTTNIPQDLDSPVPPGTTDNKSYFYHWTFFNYYFTSNGAEGPTQEYIDDFVTKYGRRFFSRRLITASPTQTPLSITKIVTGGGGGGVDKYVDLTDVQFTPSAGTNGYVSHYDHTLGKFVGTPEMKVDPTNRNIALDTTGAGAILSAGPMGIQSTGSTFVAAANTGINIVSQNNNVSVFAATGNVQVTGGAGVDLTATTALTTTQNSMVSTSTLTTKIETLGGKMEVLSAGDSDLKASGNILVQGSGASVIATTNPLFLQSLTDGAQIQALGISNVSGEGFSVSAVDNINLATSGGELTTSTNGIQRLKVTNAGQITSQNGYVPLTNPDLVTKEYTDGQVSNKLSKAGDTDGAGILSGTLDNFPFTLVQNGASRVEMVDDGTTNVIGPNALNLDCPNGQATLSGENTNVGCTAVGGKITLGPSDDPNSYVQIRTTAIKTAEQYAQDVTGVSEAVPNVEYVDTNINAVNLTKVSKGGDIMTGPLIVGTANAENLNLITNNTTKFVLGTGGLLQSQTANYETLVLNNNDMTNKKYTDDKISAQPLEDHSNLNTTANPGSDDLFLRWNTAVSAWDQDYVRIRVLPQLIGAPSVQGSVAIDDDDNKFTATILTGGAPARYVFTPMSVAISAAGSPAYAGFNTAYSPYARLVGADMSGSGAGFTWPSVAGTPASASLVNKGTNIPAPSAIFADGTKQGVRLPGEAGPNPQVGFGIALSAPISTWTVAIVMKGLPDPAGISSRLFSYNNNTGSTTASNLIQIMNGSTLHNRQILNGVSSLWPIASANSTITQATGNTTVFVFQYDSTRITDRYQVWKANATSLTSMVTSAVVISQPSISQWQVNGDNISACGMDVAEVIFWNNYQTSGQIDVWTNTLLEEYGARISGASYERILAPTASDDRNSGHRLGSQWFDTTNDKAYVCIDDAAGSAIWKETTKEITRDLNDVSSAIPTDRQSLMWMSSMNHYMPMLMKMPIGEIFGGGTQTPAPYTLNLTTQNVWYEVAYTGATLVTNNADFATPNFDQPSVGRIRWIDAVLSPLFHTAFSASVSVGSANQSFEIALGLNGGTTIPSGDAAIIPGSVISKDFAANNVTDSLAFHKVRQLTLNDTLSVYLRCTSGNNVNATFTNLNLVCVSANMW